MPESSATSDPVLSLEQQMALDAQTTSELCVPETHNQSQDSPAATVSVFEQYVDAADWYRRCLEDVIDRRTVRGLAEAKAGYDSALDAVRDLYDELGAFRGVPSDPHAARGSQVEREEARLAIACRKGGATVTVPASTNPASGGDSRHAATLSGWSAEIEPLNGKYYGSYVKLIGPNGETDGIEVWVMGDHKPSERELEAWDEDEYGPYEINDSHYETQFGYEVCKLIVEAMNGAS